MRDISSETGVPHPCLQKHTDSRYLHQARHHIARFQSSLCTSFYTYSILLKAALVCP